MGRDRDPPSDVTTPLSSLDCVGRRVEWSSQGGGIPRLKRGIVVAVRKDRSSPWQWLSETERTMNEATPASEHYNGRTVSRCSSTNRIIVRLDASSGRQLHSRYYTPHTSTLTVIDAPAPRKITPQ